MHLEVEPLYEKVALMDTYQSVTPSRFLYLAVLVLVIVLVVENSDIFIGDKGASFIVVSM